MVSVQNSNDGHVFPRSYAATLIGSTYISLKASDVTSTTNSTFVKGSGDFISIPALSVYLLVRASRTWPLDLVAYTHLLLGTLVLINGWE